MLYREYVAKKALLIQHVTDEHLLVSINCDTTTIFPRSA